MGGTKLAKMAAHVATQGSGATRNLACAKWRASAQAQFRDRAGSREEKVKDERY